MADVQRCYRLFIAALSMAALPTVAWPCTDPGQLCADGSIYGGQLDGWSYYVTSNDGGPSNWNSAVTACDNLNVYGHDDWSLMNMYEWQTICRNAHTVMSLSSFGNYHTSTEYNSSNIYDFTYVPSVGLTNCRGNFTSGQSKSTTRLYRCVRKVAVGTGGGGADNLGNHTATEDLMMDSHAVRDASGYFHDSDRNLKSDIKPISGLSIIEKLTGYSFTLNRDGRKSSGIIAQELETVMPQAVLTDEKTGRKQVEYDQIIAPLIEATKELSTKVQALDEDNRALREEVRELKETR